MQLTLNLLSLLTCRTVPVSLLTSLAIGAFSTVYSPALTAQTQQVLPTTIPNLSGYDAETQRSMELACISQKVDGPVAYGACLNRQIASLQRSPGIPNLRGYDAETQRSMELACISQKVGGPVAYGACLNRQIASLKRSPGIPNLNGNNLDTRQTAPSASSGGKTNSNKSKQGGTASRSVNTAGRFTTDNVMKVRAGMKSEKILEMFGAPNDVSQTVCGQSVGTPWACTTWVYGNSIDDRSSFTFSDDNGSLVLNNFSIHRK